MRGVMRDVEIQDAVDGAKRFLDGRPVPPSGFVGDGVELTFKLSSAAPSWGFEVRKRGSFIVVSGIEEDSVADFIGLNLGDVLVSINESFLPYGKDLGSVHSFLRHQKSHGEYVLLRIRRYQRALEEIVDQHEEMQERKDEGISFVNIVRRYSPYLQRLYIMYSLTPSSRSAHKWLMQHGIYDGRHSRGWGKLAEVDATACLLNKLTVMHIFRDFDIVPEYLSPRKLRSIMANVLQQSYVPYDDKSYNNADGYKLQD